MVRAANMDRRNYQDEEDEEEESTYNEEIEEAD